MAKEENLEVVMLSVDAVRVHVSDSIPIERLLLIVLQWLCERSCKTTNDLTWLARILEKRGPILK